MTDRDHQDSDVLGKYTPAAPVQGEEMVQGTSEPASAPIGHPAAEDASPPNGYTEAEGYAASIRLMVKWIKDGDIAEIGDIDTDELLAAANLVQAAYQFINELETRIKRLEADLHECREYLEGAVDVVDGDYGEPHPNRAMQLVTMIDETLAANFFELAANFFEPFPAESGAQSK